jgi:hypothetical protein
MWREGTDGALYGVVMWSMAIVAVLLLAVLGSGVALGSATDVARHLGINVEDIQESADHVDADAASDRAESAAGATLLGLGLTLVAAVAGATVGSKM